MNHDDNILAEAHALRAALDFLNTIDEREWEEVCGSQCRTEFARLAVDGGEDIESAWIDAVVAAEGL